MSAAENPPESLMEALLDTELEIPPWSYLVPGALVGVIIGIWLLVAETVTRSWALSRASFGQSWAELALHIFVHGGLVHVLLNAVALAVVGPRLMARVGSPVIASARFLYVFLGSGLAGGVMFLLLNDSPEASVLGASGAIFGMIGALARVHPATGVAVSILSRRSWLLARMFVRDHAVMFALIVAALVLTGQSAMVAWEAHLGGMLFGLFIAPLFLPRPADTPKEPAHAP